MNCSDTLNDVIFEVVIETDAKRRPMDVKLFLADDATALETKHLCDAIFQRLMVQIRKTTNDGGVTVFECNQLDHPNDPNLAGEDLGKNTKDEWKSLLNRNLIGSRD